MGWGGVGAGLVRGWGRVGVGVGGGGVGAGLGKGWARVGEGLDFYTSKSQFQKSHERSLVHLLRKIRIRKYYQSCDTPGHTQNNSCRVVARNGRPLHYIIVVQSGQGPKAFQMQFFLPAMDHRRLLQRAEYSIPFPQNLSMYVPSDFP